MSDDWDIKIEGFGELNRKLKKLRGRGAMRVRTNATKAGLRVIMRGIKKDASTPENSGYMRARMTMGRPKNWPKATWVKIKVPFPGWMLEKGIRSKVHAGWMSDAVRRYAPAAVDKFILTFKRAVYREWSR